MKTCSKPNCNCAEIHENNNGLEALKIGYPCLANNNDAEREIRQAISPLSVPVKGEEKVEEATYTNGLDDGDLHGWNSAIDACIKAAIYHNDNYGIYDIEEFKAKLKSLRK